MAEKKDSTSTDRRVRRTKKLMAQTLFQLMQKKPLTEISVRELAEQCDINRGTFYMYYQDIYDMLNQIEDEMFQRFNTILAEQEANIEARETYPFLRALTSFAEENKPMCKVLLSPHGDMRFLERLNKLLEDKCHAEWQKFHAAISEEEFELGYSFVIFGCIGMLRTWINNDHPVSSDHLAHLADQMLRKGALSLVSSGQQ